MNIRKTVTTMKTTSGSVTDYCGNFIYADNQLIIIFAGDVRIAPLNFGNSTYWKYEYSMKDHLGNTRVVFAAHSYGQPELLQQTSYYPFGMTMQQQNFYSQNATENKYLYNSKELQDDQLAGNTCYLPNKGTEFSHLSWPRGVYGDMPGDGEEFMGGGSHTPFLESRKKTEKVVEEKVEQGDFNNFDLFDFYVSSFETPGMSFNVQIHPDIDGEETEEEKKPAGQGDNFFEDARGYTLNFGHFKNGAAMTIAGVGIFVGPGDANNIDLLRHEYGHILQYKKWGAKIFWGKIVPASLKSANKANNDWSFNHMDTWTEWSANRLSYQYFNQPPDWSPDYPIWPTTVRPGVMPPFVIGLFDFKYNWLDN